MSDTLSFTAPLTRWQGDRGTYALMVLPGAPAEALAIHARLRRLEYGRLRGFGSVKVTARIGDTEWSTSVFPQRQSTEWVLLVSRKVMKAEGLAEGDPVALVLDPA